MAHGERHPVLHAFCASMVEGEEAGAEMSMVSLELSTAESHSSPAPILS